MKKARCQNTNAEFIHAKRRWNGIPWLRLTTFMFGLSLLSMSSSASAAPISPDKVRKAVETWVRQVTADARTNAAIERIEPYRENGVPMAYIVHLSNGGFCLAGASSLTLPVYLYCPKGVYDPKDPNCQLILEEIAQRHGFLEGEAAKNGAIMKTYQDEFSRRARSWDDLAVGNGATSKAAQPQGSPIPQGGPVPQGQPISSGPAELVLPVTSRWNQNPPPYEDYCPTLPAGVTPNNTNLTVVGCVATAQAQELYYWKWPSNGVGNGSDTYTYFGTSVPLTAALAGNPGIPGDFSPHLSWANGVLTMTGWWDGSMLAEAQAYSTNGIYQQDLSNLYGELTSYQETVTADFTHTIDWSVMQDSYTYEYANVNSPNYVDSQIAYLDFELGVGVNMSYGVSGSGSYASAIPGNLTSHFHYDPSAQDIGLDTNQIVLEIQWMRPCIVGGNDHCWMVYGYNMGTMPWQYMMNMGWGGIDNGWYTIDNVAKNVLTYPTHINDLVVDLAPLKVVGFVGASSSGSGSPNSPYQNIEEAVTNAPAGATLIFQANSTNTFSAAPLVINRPLKLEGYNVTIMK